MMHTRHARFCRLVQRGILHQRRTVRGFHALATLSPNMDAAALMHALACNARASVRALRRMESLHCLLQNNNTLL
ncbi:MAG: hypothetical protein DDT39_01047 [Firmicutes bacterium]|nr:hypothetical protein [candidate division NPL-UPA2 bacterium]MBT9154375.1 hypothetical protein [candidate division NPL-UPA2 bacterium]